MITVSRQVTALCKTKILVLLALSSQLPAATWSCCRSGANELQGRFSLLKHWRALQCCWVEEVLSPDQGGQI